MLWSITSNAQEDYNTLSQKALKSMQQAKNEEDNQKTLHLYEDLFLRYPDSIEGVDLFRSAAVATRIMDKEKAFLFLNQLQDTKDDDYPYWNYILAKYTESELKILVDDSRWQHIKQKAQTEKNIFFTQLQEKENEFYANKGSQLHEIKEAKILYKNIQKYNPYLNKEEQNYSISFPINDSTKTSFFIHLPSNYNPNKVYPLLFFLHGAVRGNSLVDYQKASWNLDDWNRYYTKYADQNEVILVFPRGNKQYNWMTSDDGFFMVPAMLKLIKNAVNIDDNKVFISGHSNGATGAFSYYMKQASPFAGFYGFNTYPKVFTGGTFIENGKNRSFINFSTDEDYYYPPNANDDFTKLMKATNVDYKEFRYNGFPHWFPEFDESEPAYKILFHDLMTRQRNPFPHEISWEFDDEKYGNMDWLSSIELDTIGHSASAYQPLNFKINKWLSYDKNDSLISKDVDRNAFDFPRKSGKIKAQFDNNIFRIETSNIKGLIINISPEMVNMNKNVKVYVNGKLYYNKKIDYNKDYILECFDDNKDRTQIWVNHIDIKI